MSFLIGPMKKHIDGHKELTAHNEIVKLADQAKVYIPLLMGNAKIEVCVKEGDLVKIGDVVALRNDHFYVPIYASVSGKVLGIEKRMGSNLRPTDHIVIENDNQYIVADNLSTLDENADAKTIVEFIKEKGLVGCGGAGFPTYVKYLTDKCETLIINAVECEPYITADARMMEEHQDYFKTGVKAMFKASNAKKCLIGIKESKKALIPILVELFKEETDIVVSPVEDVYPMGWERTLLYSLLKKRYDRLPIEVGCIVSNATTAIMLGQAMKTGLPIVEKMVTVSGDAVKEPHNVLVRVGTPFSELVKACGGYTKEAVSLIAGGPMMGTAVTKEEVCVGLATNAVTVLEYKEPLAVNCLRCGKCVDHCPSSLQPVNINNALKANDFDRLAKLKPMDCIECGMCTYICPSKIEVTEGVRRAKRMMALKVKK